MPWQEVMEQLDPSLEPMISKAVIKVGASLTTKLNNPHDTFEISTKVTYLYLRLTPHYLLSLTTYLEISPKLGSHQS